MWGVCGGQNRQVKEEKLADWPKLSWLATVWSHATADRANGGWFPTGCVAAEGHGWVALSSPCVHWPSSLPHTPPPELVTGRRATLGRLPLLESKQKKKNSKKYFTNSQISNSKKAANRCLKGETAVWQIPKRMRAAAINVCASVSER